ncbi:MAG: DUF7594 domain-containing protein [Actinomycetota bacterium]
MAGLLALGLLAALQQGAGAKPPSARPSSMCQTNGRVRSMVLLGDTLYMGGDFTALRPSGGGAEVARNYLGACSASTGSILSWNPNADNNVMSLDTDGSRILAGGDFTAVGGSSRTRLAALDPATGRVLSWAPRASGSVRAMAISGSTVFLGGNFGLVNGENRSRLAAVDAAGGSLRSWNPTADDTVRTLLVSGNRVFAGGHFTGYLKVLDAATGAPLAWQSKPGWPVLGLAASSTRLYIGGSGKGGHLSSHDLAKGASKWEVRSDGNFQAVAVLGDVLYGGGHFNTCRDQARGRLCALNSDTGSLYSWNPGTDGYTEGVYALKPANSYLFVAGDFKRVAGEPQQGVARFAASSGATPPVSDSTPPAVSITSPVDRSRVSGAVTVEVSASDAGGVTKVELYLDGRLLGTDSAFPYTFSWDTTTAAKAAHELVAKAYDPAGNQGISAPVSVTVAAPAQQTLVFTPAADATIKPDLLLPGNYGDAPTLDTGGSPAQHFLMKFKVAGVSGRRVTRATLRLHNLNSSAVGGELHRVMGNAWSESRVTWSNAPDYDPAPVASLGAVSSGSWYELDVTSVVRGDTTFSVRMTSNSPDDASYASREAGSGLAPQLVVTVS